MYQQRYTETEMSSLLRIFSSLVAPEIVKMTNSSATSDDNFLKMATSTDDNFVEMVTFPFQRALDTWTVYVIMVVAGV